MKTRKSNAVVLSSSTIVPAVTVRTDRGKNYEVDWDRIEGMDPVAEYERLDACVGRRGYFNTRTGLFIPEPLNVKDQLEE